MFSTIIDWILYLDVHLAALAAGHALLVYAVLFVVIFVETGVVVLPFLPGDPLLFVAGAMAAQGTFSWPMLGPLLVLAAVAGDSLNFSIGERMRDGVLANEDVFRVQLGLVPVAGRAMPNALHASLTVAERSATAHCAISRR